jgi:ribonuclease HI
VWNDSKSSAQQLGIQAVQYWQHWVTVNGLLQQQQQPAEQQPAAGSSLQWQPPPNGYLKCNVDASFYNTEGVAGWGWGWCLQDCYGNFRLAGTNLMNSPLTTLEGEAMAIVEAMHEMIHGGFSNVIFESDSKLVVVAISSRQVIISEFSILISHIQSLLCMNNYFEVKRTKLLTL